MFHTPPHKQPYCNLCKCAHGAEKAAEHLARLRSQGKAPNPFWVWYTEASRINKGQQALDLN